MLQKSTLSVSYLGQLAAKENPVPYVDQISVEGLLVLVQGSLVDFVEIFVVGIQVVLLIHENQIQSEREQQITTIYLGILRVHKLNTYLAFADWETLHDQNFL